MTWKGHVAIVTGAGSGIGKGIAARFAEAGAEVVIAEVNPQRGEAAAQELQAVIETIRLSSFSATTTPYPASTLEWPW